MDFLPWIHHITTLHEIIKEEDTCGCRPFCNGSVNVASFVKEIKDRKELWNLKKNVSFNRSFFAAVG